MVQTKIKVALRASIMSAHKKGKVKRGQ